MIHVWHAILAAILFMGISRRAATRDARILRLALAATAAADFLFAAAENPLYGLCMFCCVQMIYCLRYSKGFFNPCPRSVKALRGLCREASLRTHGFKMPLLYGGAGLCRGLAAFWAAAFPALLFARFDIIMAAGAMYAAAFACSLGAALRSSGRYPRGGLFVTAGMGLFACCDVCVAVNYLFPGSADSKGFFNPCLRSVKTLRGLCREASLRTHGFKMPLL